MFCHFFFFNDTATTEIYTLSLHDALPISGGERANVGDVLEVRELLGDALGLVDRQDERRAREELGPERLARQRHVGMPERAARPPRQRAPVGGAQGGPTPPLLLEPLRKRMGPSHPDT